MNQVPPPPPMQPAPPRGMAGPPRQQQGFPQHFPQQPPPFQQRPTVITDDRFNPDQQINNVARIHNIVPIKQKTEKDYRKDLTTYAAYTISPSKDGSAKDKKDKDKRSFTSKSLDKGTWTQALIIEQFFAQDDIAKTIKKLDEKESVTKKMKELGANQSTQVSNILDGKLMSERDPQFEWVVAQLDKAFNPDKNKRKSTKSITIYLRRAPKVDVDCMELLRRRDQRKFEQQQLHQQNLDHARNVQAIQRQQEMQQLHQQGQQQQVQRMGHPPMHGGRGRGLPPGILPVESVRSSDSSRSSSSDSDSESDANSDTTPESVSTRPSRNTRHRRDKQYYRRGTSRNRSRSRKRTSREKDYLAFNHRRRRDSRPAVHYVPDSPRSPRESSRPGLPRSSTYNGHPSVRVQTSRDSHEDFFNINQHSPRMTPRPIIHHRPDVVSAPSNVEIISAAVQAGLQAGAKVARDERLTADMGALALQRPPANYHEPLPRPPLPHSSFADFTGRTRMRHEVNDALAEAEAIQRQDERARIRRAMQTRSPPRASSRDNDRRLDRTVPRKFDPESYDQYRSSPMSPSLSSGSSGVSYASRGRRDPYPSTRDREYDYRREGQRLDEDSDYDFIGRDEANPFQPLSGRRTSPRPSMQSRRASYMAGPPYSRDRY